MLRVLGKVFSVIHLLSSTNQDHITGLVIEHLVGILEICHSKTNKKVNMVLNKWYMLLLWFLNQSLEDSPIVHQELYIFLTVVFKIIQTKHILTVASAGDISEIKCVNWRLCNLAFSQNCKITEQNSQFYCPSIKGMEWF